MLATLDVGLGPTRRSRFVGRADELAVFDGVLRDGAFAVLYVQGEPGVGKTTLLHAFAGLAAGRGIAVHRLDLRDLEPTPEAFVRRLEQLTPLHLDRGRIGGAEGRLVLLLDTLEAVEPLHPWLVGTFLPLLPAGSVVVGAGTRPAPLAWRADPLLADAGRTLVLGRLAPAEADAVLGAAGVPAAARPPILAFAGGHPLALVLAADTFRADPAAPFDPARHPDVVAALLGRFLQHVPDVALRTAIYAAAVVRTLNEPLLGALLTAPGGPPADAHAPFEWLRGRAVVQADGRGLFLHDFVRDLLAADLRWRDPALDDALRARARAFYSARLLTADPDAHASILADYLFLFRDSPVVRPFFERLQTAWAGTFWRAGAAGPDDHPAAVALVRRHEGDAAADLAAYWLGRQPEGLRVYRDDAGTVGGCLFGVALDAATDADAARDPAVAAALGHLAAHAPLRGDRARGGERATLFRFWMAADGYQKLSAVQSLVFVDTVRHYLTTPRLAFTFLPVADPGQWDFVLRFAGLDRLPAADFATDGRAFAVYGHDWRALSPSEWLAAIAARGGRDAGAPLPAPEAPARLVLGPDAFADAVKDALRHATRPTALETNPLVRTKLVTRAAAGDEAPAEALVRLLRAAAAGLDGAPRSRKLYRALDATFFDPSPTQEQAAERLDLPFSTYRRHLRGGIDAVAASLWRQELEI